MSKQMSKRWRAADRRQVKRIAEIRQRADARRARAGIERRQLRPSRAERDED